MAAPWKQLLLKAIESNSHLKHSSFFQLATVRSDGRPANRTVVFRGFEADTDKIQINTDRRSHKIEDLKHCPFSEVLTSMVKPSYFFQICWYFTDTWEQFRLLGKVEVIDGTTSDTKKLQQREKSWFSSSLKSRVQYLGPIPGLPSTDDNPANNPTLDPSVGPVDAYCLLILDPDQVDYVNLKTNKTIFSTSSRTVNGDKHWN